MDNENVPKEERYVVKSKLYEFDIESAYGNAYDFTVLSCGFDPDQKKNHRILDECLSVFDSVKEKIRLQAMVREFPADVYSDSGIHIEGNLITCNAFGEISPQNVKKVFIAMVTAGDWSSNGKISRQVYMDMWGTAFVDSTKILLEKELMGAMDTGLCLSNPFGPGYYGMPLVNTKQLSAILGSVEIGVSVRDSGIMIPEKTMTMIYLATDSDTILPPIACSECFGSSRGCKSCDKYFKK